MSDQPQERDDWEEAVLWCDELIDSVGFLPEHKRNLSDGLSSSIYDMQDWIKSHRRVTPKQLIALENWEELIERLESE